MQRQETDRFDAVAEDGDECTIIEYTRMTSRKSLAGRTQHTAGGIEYFTDSGDDGNPEGDGVFEVVQTGKRFKRV